MSDMYCKACGQDSANLLRQLADLKRRIRLARKEVHDGEGVDGWPSHGAILRAVLLLDLRRPLPKRRKR